MPKIPSEKSKMLAAEFAQTALQTRIAPRSLGLVKVRLPYAQSVMKRRGWTANRVRDFWYLDERAAEPTWTEITDLEDVSGLQFARQELRTNDQIIANAEALLMGSDPDFASAFVAAFRAMARAFDRTRASGD